MEFCVKVYKDGDEEFKKLQKAAMRLTELSPNKYKYYVGTAWFDYGAAIKWTTVLCNNGGEWGDFQALNPRDQASIVISETDEQIDEVVRFILSDHWCPDRLK